ncbi:uncharacterized protein LOC110007850 isoform X2 [Amborella trichopoda]|uniref:uncharacterized protein LOC110007850 isoform X2 n=1 Tax=Amborella trichopoda TaxID=13333 RepID=UPI0009C189B0|nr:uncharacterized protein LOC110007850 isoform X2 [Amborella trichopoda]|eukprot:XP_020527250.1 uncharacterized protein LOC110007850 isoform X2 [Amborella trichopoda]
MTHTQSLSLSLSMKSSASHDPKTQTITGNEQETAPADVITAARVLSSSRTKSFCSSLSSSSFSSSSSSLSYPLSPASPLHFPSNSASKIPFSWEKQPGIPKQAILSLELLLRERESAVKTGAKNFRVSDQALPPPPPVSSISSSKKKPQENDGDPFLTALIECSKDQRAESLWKNSRKVCKSSSFRLSFVDIYTSCKRTSSVTECHVLLPRSSNACLNLLNKEAVPVIAQR